MDQNILLFANFVLVNCKYILGVNHFPNDKLKTLPKSDFIDCNLKFDENGKKFSKRVEKTVEKGESAC